MSKGDNFFVESKNVFGGWDFMYNNSRGRSRGLISG